MGAFRFVRQVLNPYSVDIFIEIAGKTLERRAGQFWIAEGYIR